MRMSDWSSDVCSSDLRNRGGKVRRIAGRAGVEDRRHARPQASHAEDEQVDRVGDERQPDNDLEGPRPQQQPHARSGQHADRSEEHTSELQSLMRISYAVFCLKKKKKPTKKS